MPVKNNLNFQGRRRGDQNHKQTTGLGDSGAWKQPWYKIPGVGVFDEEGPPSKNQLDLDRIGCQQGKKKLGQNFVAKRKVIVRSSQRVRASRLDSVGWTEKFQKGNQELI